MILGLLILAGGAMLLIPLENWIHRHLEGAGDFLAEHVYLPLARVILVIGFLYCVFPSPLIAGEALSELAGQRLPKPPWQSLLNMMFLVGLALPLLPQTQKFSGLVMPVQTLIGAWLLISALPIELELGTPTTALGTYAAACLLSHVLVRHAAKQLAERYRLDHLSVYDCLILASQPPLVLLVTRSLQLAP